MIETESIKALIENSDLFSNLDDVESGALAREATIIRHASGSRIFRQGDPADALYLIQCGEVEVEVRTPGDDLKELTRMGPGQVLGDLALLSDTRRLATATAATDVVLVAIDPHAFRQFSLARNQAALKIHLQFGKLLSGRIRDINATIGGREMQAVPDRESTPMPPGKSTVSARYRQFMSHMPFFDAFSETEIDEIAAMFTERRVSRGQHIFSQNVAGDSCFLITRGAVEISIAHGRGRQRLAVRGPGRIFGEMCLLDGGAHPGRRNSRLCLYR